MQQTANKQQHRHRRLIWVVSLIVSMLFVQGMQLHVHAYSHDDPDSLGHLHHDQLHSGFVLNQQPHDDEVAQIDFSHSGFINKISFTPLMAIMLVLSILLMCARYCYRISWHYFDRPRYRFNAVLALPNLRAPPK